jgi:hypothetical protein
MGITSDLAWISVNTSTAQEIRILSRAQLFLFSATPFAGPLLSSWFGVLDESVMRGTGV